MSHPLSLNFVWHTFSYCRYPYKNPYYRKSERDRGRESVLELRGLLLPFSSPPVIRHLLNDYALNKLCKNPGVP
jgi:hypothetical protein